MTTWLDLSDHRADELDGFDLVVVGGGNTYDLLHRIREAGVAAALRRFLRAGGTSYGGSAGAIVAGPSIGLASGHDADRHHDPDDSGLGLVPVEVLPHFTEARRGHAEAWSTRHRARPVLCLPEASGVRVSGTEALVLGPDPVDLYRGGRHVGRHHQGAVVALL